MRSIACRLFPGGKPLALTLSYDDGTVDDRRLVEIMDYLVAARSLRIGAAGSATQNLSGQEVWIENDGVVVSIPPGRTVKLQREVKP